MKKRELLICGAIGALILVAVVCAVICFNELRQYQEAQEEYDELVSNSTSTIPKLVNTYTGGSTVDEPKSYGDPTSTGPVENTPISYSLPDLAIDFKSLLNTNKDCIGWIYIPSLELSYPVVQSADNQDYISKTFNGKSNMSGCIFSDCRIDAPFVQKTILYGHNMKNGTMFHKLFDIEIAPEANKDIWIYLANGHIYHYVVEDVQRVKMNDKEIYSIGSTYSDELILSTCVKNELRLVVIARRDYVVA